MQMLWSLHAPSGDRRILERALNETLIINIVFKGTLRNQGVTVKDDHVYVTVEDNKPFLVPHSWLRDHCRSPKMYDHRMQQLASDILKRGVDIQPSSVEMVSDSVNILWSDRHVTNISADFIMANILETRPSRDEKKLWDVKSFKKGSISKVDINTFLKSDTAVKQTLQSIAKFGVAMITGVKSTADATIEAISVIGPIMKIFYGEFEVLSPDERANRSDTANTHQYIGPHTDKTYFTEAPGLQIFSAFQRATEGGGETLLVDSFKVAKEMKKKFPQHYKLLSTYPTAFEYHHSHSKPHYHYHNEDFILKHDKITGELFQVRYNMYDRAPLSTVPHDLVDKYYAALQNFARLVNHESNVVKELLETGTILLLDNYRVMHGRNSFSGEIKMWAGYMSRSDLLNAALVRDVRI